MARGIDVRAVVVRIRIRPRLHALVARPPASGRDAPASEHRDRFVELVLLRVIDEVARDDDGLRRELVDRLDRRGEDLAGQRLLRTKG